MLVVCYVENILFWARNDQCILKFSEELQKVGLFIEEEEDDAVFLGVDFSWDENGNIVMTKTVFIGQILTSLSLD